MTRQEKFFMFTLIIDRLGHDVKSARQFFYQEVLGIVHIKCSELPGWQQEVQLYYQVAHYLEQVFSKTIAQLERLERSKGLEVRPIPTNYKFKAIVSNPKKNTDYIVANEYSDWTCTCPDHQYRQWSDNGRLLCKHILAAQIVHDRSSPPAEDKTVANNRKLFELVNNAIAPTSLKITSVDLKNFRVELSQNGEKVAEIWQHGDTGKLALRCPFQPVDYFECIENAVKIVLHTHNFQTGKYFCLV